MPVEMFSYSCIFDTIAVSKNHTISLVIAVSKNHTISLVKAGEQSLSFKGAYGLNYS